MSYGDPQGQPHAPGWAPPPAQVGGPPAFSPGPTLVTVGDIACGQHTVTTPNGTYPLQGTTWIVTNSSTVTEAIPTYAIVLAIVFALACLLGLLFLLIKEKRYQGFVQVSVQGPGFFHATQVPVTTLATVPDVEARVNYIRGLVAALPR